MSLKAAAAAFSVSPATAHRWWHRWLEAGEESSPHAEAERNPFTDSDGKHFPD